MKENKGKLEFYTSKCTLNWKKKYLKNEGRAPRPAPTGQVGWAGGRRRWGPARPHSQGRRVPGPHRLLRSSGSGGQAASGRGKRAAKTACDWQAAGPAASQTASAPPARRPHAAAWGNAAAAPPLRPPSHSPRGDATYSKAAADREGGPNLRKVEGFFHPGASVLEDKLTGHVKTQESEEHKQDLVHGDHVLNLPFPIQLNKGSWAVIQGAGAQRSQHCTPCEGFVSYSKDVRVDEVKA